MHGLRGVPDEIQRKLRQSRLKTAVGVGQAAGLADRKTDAFGTRTRPGECDVRNGDIDGGYLTRRSAFGQGNGEAPGAAPDIEHAPMIRRPRELRKRPGEQPRPPPEKPLIGGPVAGVVC